jgi:alginate O-acetyltransferase complex protein AlgJ
MAMQTFYRFARLALPAVFLSYGIGATAFMIGAGRLVVKPTDTLLSGGLTAQIDAVYKADLPLREVAVGLVGATRFALIGEGRKGVLTAPDGWLFTSEEARPMTGDFAGPVVRIMAVQDRLAAMGTELVLVPVPAKTDIEADRAAFPELSKALGERHSAFVAVLRAAKVPVVDIRQALNDLTGDDQAFFATDTHWTGNGAAAAARAITDDLRARGLAPDPQLYSSETEAAEVFSGDLVGFVTTPRFAPMVGLAAETVTPIRAVAPEPEDLSAGDLFGGVESGGIALVGTSYSANQRWSFADSLMLALGSDVVNHAQEGRGPVRPVADMLADPDFATAPPAVVIWEFPIRFLSDPAIWDEESSRDGT